MNKTSTACTRRRYILNIRRCLLAVTGILWLDAVATAADVDDLLWMSGCWAAVGQEAGSGEQWTPPAGGTLLGVSRTVVNGKTVAFEYLRIVTGDDGKISLVASPSGQESGVFRLLRLTAREVVFENIEHDFPQRILYRQENNTTLLGRIEGSVDGEQRHVDFPLTRIECGNIPENQQ